MLCDSEIVFSMKTSSLLFPKMWEFTKWIWSPQCLFIPSLYTLTHLHIYTHTFYGISMVSPIFGQKPTGCSTLSSLLCLRKSASMWKSHVVHHALGKASRANPFTTKWRLPFRQPIHFLLPGSLSVGALRLGSFHTYLLFPRERKITPANEFLPAT